MDVRFICGLNQFFHIFYSFYFASLDPGGIPKVGLVKQNKNSGDFGEKFFFKLFLVE